MSNPIYLYIDTTADKLIPWLYNKVLPISEQGSEDFKEHWEYNLAYWKEMGRDPEYDPYIWKNPYPKDDNGNQLKGNIFFHVQILSDKKIELQIDYDEPEISLHFQRLITDIKNAYPETTSLIEKYFFEKGLPISKSKIINEDFPTRKLYIPKKSETIGYYKKIYHFYELMQKDYLKNYRVGDIDSPNFSLDDFSDWLKSKKFFQNKKVPGKKTLSSIVLLFKNRLLK